MTIDNFDEEGNIDAANTALAKYGLTVDTVKSSVKALETDLMVLSVQSMNAFGDSTERVCELMRQWAGSASQVAAAMKQLNESTTALQNVQDLVDNYASYANGTRRLTQSEVSAIAQQTGLSEHDILTNHNKTKAALDIVKNGYQTSRDENFQALSGSFTQNDIQYIRENYSHLIRNGIITLGPKMIEKIGNNDLTQAFKASGLTSISFKIVATPFDTTDQTNEKPATGASQTSGGEKDASSAGTVGLESDAQDAVAPESTPSDTKNAVSPANKTKSTATTQPAETVIVLPPTNANDPTTNKGQLTTAYNSRANNYGFGFDGVTLREKRDLVNSLYGKGKPYAYDEADAATKQALGA